MTYSALLSRRHKKKLSLYIRSFVLLLLFFGYIFANNTQTFAAQKFGQVSLRLDRLQANTSLSGTICAKPSTASAGTEGKIVVTFPSDFSINSSTSQWSTNTSNLPDNTSAWPSISTTPTNISGRQVTFTSGDLTSSAIVYCFNFQSLTSTSGSTGSKIGTIATTTSGNTVIDQTDYVIQVVTSDQITITALVPADPTDFSATLTKLHGNSRVNENNTLSYEIAYESHLSYPIDISVQAAWSLGTVVGSGIPSVEILRYDTGSASTAYGNVQPVIDPVNRTITWTINNFPGNTNGVVRFNLITTNTFTSSSEISFDVSGRVLGPGTATPDSTITTRYLYSSFNPYIPGPTATPGPALTSTPTPTPVVRSVVPKFETVEINTISANDARISITTSQDTSLSILYGTSPTQLTSTISALSLRKNHTVLLPDLKPNTQYYFRVTATNSVGRTIRSDFYTFTTALVSKIPTLLIENIIATSEKVILLSPQMQKSPNKSIVLPQNSIFEIQLSLGETLPLQSIQLFLRNSNVLGLMTYVYADEPVTQTSSMLELKSGVFAGRLRAPKEIGMYEIYAKVQDFNGNIAEQKIGTVKITKPFLILEEKTNKPIEQAKITLYIYTERTRLYELLSQQSLPINNPLYSESDGRVLVTLPQGKYRAAIEGIRNEKKTIDFTIGMHPGEEYPTVFLKNASFSIIGTITYFISTCRDLLSSGTNFLTDISNSSRFFELNALIILGCFVLLSLFALASRLHMPLSHLPSFFVHLLTMHPQTGYEKIIMQGSIVDTDTKDKVTDADIYLIDKASGDILLRTTTNANGQFKFPILPVFNYVIEIAKPSYHPMRFTIHEAHASENRVFALAKHNKLPSLKESISEFIASILSLSFEFLLFLSLIFAIYLGIAFGFQVVFPFLILSICNLFFWELHRTHKHLGNL